MCARCEELELEVKRLRSLLEPEFDFPRKWRLTQTDQRVLSTLMTGRTVTRDYIGEVLYGIDALLKGERTIDVYVYKLRTKFREANLPIRIHTVWGAGYVMDPESIAFIKKEMGNHQ